MFSGGISQEVQFFFMIVLLIAFLFMIIGMIGIFLIKDLKNLKDFIETREKDIIFKNKPTLKHYVTLLSYGQMILLNKDLRDKINKREY